MPPRHYQLEAPARPDASRVSYDTALNAEQLAVVEAPPGPVLVIAGAGSGKTRTLVYRLARMIESGIPPEQILLLTFTNRAAKEMLGRATELLQKAGGFDPRRMWGGTFHHVGSRLLREHGAGAGHDPAFGLLDREDQADLMAACIAEAGLSVGQRRFPKADVVVDLYSTAVNTQRPLLEVVVDRRPQFGPQAEELLKVAARYVERKLELNVMDFDDLLLNWKLLLTENAAVRAHLQQRFRCILVDEYQDTNRLQGDIVDLLAAGHKNLTVVGDDAQSIYSFRGADFTNILEFPARYEGCQVLRLTVNYRSSPEILRLANLSIACNLRQYRKELTASRPERGSLPALVPARDAIQQAAFIAQRILELRDEGFSLAEMAVLYRAHYQSMEIQIELARRKIPFVIRSGVRFFEQQHVKDVLAFLKVVENPQDELSFKRVVKLFPGIGSQTADALWAAYRTVASGARRAPRTALLRDDVMSHVPKKGQAGWERCRTLLHDLTDPGVMGAPAEAIDLVLSGGYADYLRGQFANGDSRADDLRQLAEYALSYPDVGTFLAEVGLLAELSTEEVVEGSEPDEKLTLSSVHQAKGLEWRAVFVAWLADGRFPSAPALRDVAGEEEERRCFYVAVTRAQDELHLCYPILAAPRDGERVLLKPSRFLQELPGGDDAPFERWTLDEPGQRPEPAALPAAPSRAALADAARKLLGAATAPTSPLLHGPGSSPLPGTSPLLQAPATSPSLPGPGPEAPASPLPQPGQAEAPPAEPAAPAGVPHLTLLPGGPRR